MKKMFMLISFVTIPVILCIMIARAGLPDASTAQIVTITSSSSLADAKNDFSARNLTDMERKKCWCEGAKGDGIGESFTVTFDREVELKSFYIFNGLGDERYFEKNNRVKAFRINNSVTVTIDEYGITGEFGFRRVELPEPVRGKKITFAIAGVHKGTKWQDTCVAEIAFKNIGVRPWISKEGNFPVKIAGNWFLVELLKGGDLGGPGIVGHQCDTPFLGGTWKLHGDSVLISYQYREWTKCGNLMDDPKDDEYVTRTVNETVTTLVPE